MPLLISCFKQIKLSLPLISVCKAIVSFKQFKKAFIRGREMKLQFMSSKKLILNPDKTDNVHFVFSYLIFVCTFAVCILHSTLLNRTNRTMFFCFTGMKK